MSRQVLLSFLFVASVAHAAGASFVTFQGGLAVESSWRAAAGTTVLETFDGYAVGTPIMSLPALGVGFDEIATGLYPAIYHHSVDNTPSGTPQLSNMPSGSPDPTYQNADVVLRVLSGFSVTAIGFWNGDPQGNMVASVYDASDVLLGTFVGLVNTGSDPNFSGSFAGFVSSAPIAYVHFEGTTGDGWNHIDDLQVAVRPANGAPEPSTVFVLLPLLLAPLVRKMR